MHIPDGFLSTTTWISAWTVSAGGLGCCVRQAGRAMKDRMVPLMGVLSAFIFAAQMINFPVMGGTSGHLLGGVLAAVLLGPWAGAVVIACVLIFQCLVFQDGGLTALGANILNMALAGTLGGYFMYRVMAKLLGGRKGDRDGRRRGCLVLCCTAASLCVPGAGPVGHLEFPKRPVPGHAARCSFHNRDPGSRNGGHHDPLFGPPTALS